MPVSRLLLLLLALPLTRVAFAAEPAPVACDRQGSEAQLAACAADDLAAAEARLADVYGRRLAATSPTQRTAFERLQQLQYLSCLKSVTLLRLDDLQRQLPRRD